MPNGTVAHGGALHEAITDVLVVPYSNTAYTIATERGATVKVISKTRKLRNKTTAGSKPIRKNIDVDEGTYRLAIRASDDTGNKTERSYKITVA
jgi:hypothetical protein